MNLTVKQTQRIQSITNAIQRYYGAGVVNGNSGAVSFSVQEIGNVVMLCADNFEGLRWYETAFSCHIIIGKQGGIERYVGTMSPKLVLPTTPRRCEYNDPFKKKQ